ncbi:hypothetical protein PMZ80_008286 [Knufia obscura]|nr:hypothetical protein PMZ80_008286 [Knufia obscura]
MAQESEVAAAAKGENTAVTVQQPSSPAASTSSREDTRDARERLKKTSIAGLQQKTNTTDTSSDQPLLAKSDASLTDPASETNNGIRGRPAKKRSFEDLAKDDADTDSPGAVGQPPLPKSGHHKRMRSRDVNSGDHTQAYAKVEGAKNDTVQEEGDMQAEPSVDAQTYPEGEGVLVDAPSQEEMDADATAQRSQTNNKEEPTTTTEKETRASDSATTTKIPPTSGFANASAASPFGQPRSPSKDKSPEPAKPTSSSAFASSGLSAFASSSKSPFGAAASSKSPLGAGGFGGGQSTGGFGSAKSGFGSTGGFSSTSTSGFGGGSSSFGAPKPFGSTNTFGAPKPFGTSSGFGSGPSSFGTSKPIGASSKDDEEDEEETGEDEDAAGAAKDDAEQDPRFQKQQVDTGEEGEEVHFTSRARLYFFDGAWKERGTGVFKINVRTSEDGDAEPRESDPEAQATNGKRKARLLMRADATHKVLLNSPVFKGMKFGAPDGTEPTGKLMHLQSLENGKPLPLQIKIGKEEVLKDLYHRLRELEEEA